MVSNDEVDLRDGLDFEGADAPVYDPQLQIWSSWRGTNLLKSLILMSDGSVCFFFDLSQWKFLECFLMCFKYINGNIGFVWICQLSDRCALGRNMWMIQWITQMAAVVGGLVAGTGWCSQVYAR